MKLLRSHRAEDRDREQPRDFLYVKDAVAMTQDLASAESVHGLFDLGSRRAATWLELITPVFEFSSLPSWMHLIDMPEALRGKYQSHTCASISRLRFLDSRGRLARWQTTWATTFFQRHASVMRPPAGLARLEREHYRRALRNGAQRRPPQNGKSVRSPKARDS